VMECLLNIAAPLHIPGHQHLLGHFCCLLWFEIKILQSINYDTVHTVLNSILYLELINSSVHLKQILVTEFGPIK
jgi:hypothetical protein